MADVENCAVCGKRCVPLLSFNDINICSPECTKTAINGAKEIKQKCMEKSCPIMIFISTIDRAAYPKGLFDYMQEYDENYKQPPRNKTNLKG